MTKSTFLKLFDFLKQSILIINDNPSYSAEVKIPENLRAKKYDELGLLYIHRLLNKALRIDEDKNIFSGYGGCFNKMNQTDSFYFDVNYKVLNLFRENNIFEEIENIDPTIVWFQFELDVRNQERLLRNREAAKRRKKAKEESQTA